MIPESREVPIGAQMPQGPAADVSVHASLEFYFLSSERPSPSGLCPELGLKDFFIEKPLVPISQIQYLFFEFFLWAYYLCPSTHNTSYVRRHTHSDAP